MEADLFQDIFDALQDNKNRIALSLPHSCPIEKIVWSSFDFLRGPELEFVWEADYLCANSSHVTSLGKSQLHDAAANSSEHETVDGCTNSTDSSFSKNTGVESATSTTQYEEIDEYTSELLRLSSEANGPNGVLWNNVSSDGHDLAQCSSCLNQSIMVCDAESTNDTASSQTEGGSFVHPLMRQADEPCSSALNISTQTEATLCVEPPSTHAEEAASLMFNNFPVVSSWSEAMVTSCVDSGIGGTVSIDSNLSAYAKQQDSKGEVIYRSGLESCTIKLNGMGFSNSHIPEAEEVIEFKKAYAESLSELSSESAPVQIGQDVHRTSLNSRIDCSMYSSFMSPAFSQYGQKEAVDEETVAFYREAELLAAELAPSDTFCSALSDEAFVAKYVLAEQIGSIQFSSNPVLHKFYIVPSRHICVGSYIFSARKLDQPPSTTHTLCAFSVILQLENVNWYLERQTVLAEMFSDTIARFKAAYLVESLEDVVCRCTREFMAVFRLFGALERWPLAGRELGQLRIQASHLWELNRTPNIEFLARCITACLVCRGHCTILGSNPKEVAQLMLTLATFVEPADRLFCLRPFKMPFSPYLRLQAIRRPEFGQYLEKAALSHWSIALLDIDRQSVTYTGLYHSKHRFQKVAAQKGQIAQIFREAINSGAEVPHHIRLSLEHQHINGTNLETQSVQADPMVGEFLDLICLMPLNRSARISFVDHFHLRLENRARALITYIRDISVPAPSDKRSALSSRWQLITVRRNLNLLADSAFGISLARAVSLVPDFAEFIAQHTTSAGRNIRH